MIQVSCTGLRGHLTRAGLSQEELAFEAEVHSTYVSLLERGKRNPTILVLDKLARALGTSMASIVKEVESGRR